MNQVCSDKNITIVIGANTIDQIAQVLAQLAMYSRNSCWC